jgi:hypothetical protein
MPMTIAKSAARGSTICSWVTKEEQMSKYVGPKTKPLARGLEDVARLLGVSRQHLHRLGKLGKIEVVNIGGRTVMTTLEVERILKFGVSKDVAP